MLYYILAIAIGAALGAVLRWVLGRALNSLFPLIPMGTLAANLLGGFLIGGAAAFFVQMPHLAPEWQLLVVTGFLGGLTTFSTFSAEVVAHLQSKRFAWAMAHIATHVMGSLLMTVVGFLGVYTHSPLKHAHGFN